MAFKEFLEELFAPMGGVTVRSMFGGLGVFKDTVMFALALDDVLYLRADDDSEPRYAAEKSPQFVYRGMKGRDVPMPYWRLPERLYDEADEFTVWATAALEAARRAAVAKGKGKTARQPRKTGAKAAHANKPARRPSSTKRGSKA